MRHSMPGSADRNRRALDVPLKSVPLDKEVSATGAYRASDRAGLAESLLSLPLGGPSTPTHDTDERP
jgi:hypothetical protein